MTSLVKSLSIFMIINWNDSANVILTSLMLFFCSCLTDSGSRIHLECSLGESDYHFAFWLKAPFYKTFHSAAAAVSLHFDVSILFYTRNGLRCAGASIKVCIDPSLPYFTQKLKTYIIT